MYLKTIFITALLHPAQFAALIQTSWNALIILGSISGFFTNLYIALGGLALALLAQTISGLVNGAAKGQ
jgi:hypothetical protein